MKSSQLIPIVCALASVPSLLADTYENGVLHIDQVLYLDDVYKGVDVTVGELVSNQGGLARTNYDTFSDETGTLFIPSVTADGQTYTNLEVTLGEALSYESVKKNTTLPTTLTDFQEPIEHNDCGGFFDDDRNYNGESGFIDPDLTNVELFVTHPIGAKDWHCDVVSDETMHPIYDGEKSFRFELRPGECTRNDGWDDCPNDRSRTEMTTLWTPDNYDQALTVVEYNIFIPEQTTPFSAGLPVTHFGQMYLKGSEGETLSIARLIVYSDWIYEDSPLLLFDAFPDLSYDNVIKRPITYDFFNRWMNIRFEIFGDTEEGYIKAYVDDEIYLDEKIPTLFHPTDFIDFQFGTYRSYLSRAKEEIQPIVVYYDSVSKVIY